MDREDNMVKRLILPALLCIALVPAVSGCGKSQEAQKAEEEAKQFEIQSYAEGVTPPPKPAPLPKDLQVIVPPSVKSKYGSVVMLVGNRKTKEIKKFTVKLGGKAQVPGTDFTIEVRDYLPHFITQGKTVTTKTEEPKDPVVRATIYQGGKQVFDGFIFQKHRTPSFLTDDWAIGLHEAVAR